MAIRDSRTLALAVAGVLCCALTVRGATKTCGTVALPESALAVVRARFPGMRIVQLRDLREDDQRLWSSARGHECPGVAVGRFEPSDGPAYALALFRRNGTSYTEALVVVSRHRRRYDLQVLDPPESRTYLLVVHSIPPGKLSDEETGKTVETRRDSVAYEAIEAEVVVFYWERGHYASVVASE